MKKRTKIVLAIVLSFVVILCGGLGFAGNYFYTLAIAADSDKSVVFGSSETNPEQVQAAQMKYDTFMANDSKEAWITNADGYRLHAYEGHTDSDTWVIIVHGYISDAKNMLGIGSEFMDRGYNVLLPDLRSHGESEGDAIGMGSWDSEDIVAWISYILQQQEDAKIVLYGVSMGASTVMMTTGKALPDNVIAAIEDCGYTSAWDEFAYQLDALFGLPSFPALDAANVITMLRAGYNLKDADALKAVQQSSTPTLFIHGSADDFVPASMVYPLYESASCEKELLIVEGAGHGQSRSVDPDTYWNHVQSFIQKYR